jgi:NitT/TauT family transport system ATP-binding protein
VLRNVAVPLELMHVDTDTRLAAARDAIAQVGLVDAINRFPNQLSGGMKMRVSLARAMVTKPRLLLMDEPFAALDEITRQRLDEQLLSLWSRHGTTVLFVTLSIAEAVFLSQRAIVMSRRPGRILLDRKIDLPAARAAELRSSAKFAAQTKDLFEVLRQESLASATEDGR